MPLHSPLFTETCANPIGAGNVVKGTWKKAPPLTGSENMFCATAHKVALSLLYWMMMFAYCVCMRLNDPHSWHTVGRVEVVPVPPRTFVTHVVHDAAKKKDQPEV